MVQVLIPEGHQRQYLHCQIFHQVSQYIADDCKDSSLAVCGQHLECHSGQVSEEAFCGQWYQMPCRGQ